jgi:hypothetical protein
LSAGWTLHCLLPKKNTITLRAGVTHRFFPVPVCMALPVAHGLLCACGCLWSGPPRVWLVLACASKCRHVAYFDNIFLVVGLLLLGVGLWQGVYY